MKPVEHLTDEHSLLKHICQEFGIVATDLAPSDLEMVQVFTRNALQYVNRDPAYWGWHVSGRDRAWGYSRRAWRWWRHKIILLTIRSGRVSIFGQARVQRLYWWKLSQLPSGRIALEWSSVVHLIEALEGVSPVNYVLTARFRKMFETKQLP